MRAGGRLPRRVRITYHEGVFTGPCTSSSGYFVRKIEDVGEGAPKEGGGT